MKVFHPFMFLSLLFLTFVPYASGTSVSAQHVAHQIVSRGIVSPTNAELLHNTIAFGVPALIAFVLRMINRGFVLKKFHTEDYLMIGTMFFYITLLVLINVSARYATNLYPPEQEASIFADPADVNNRIIGSKIVIALEQSMIASTWGVKLCIWTFLMRLFRQLPQFERAMWILFWYIWLGLVVIEISYYAVFCRPFNQYWAMPVKNLQCATYQHYSILQMCFNITSDLGLILMPLPMVRQARLPTQRKILLVAIFCMAGFTIMAAVLNKAYNFASPLTTTYQLWYIREASVAVCVGNLICTWQLFQKIFRLRSFNNKNATIIDEPAMPRMMKSGNIIARAWGYLTTDGKDSRYQTANGDERDTLSSQVLDGSSTTGGEKEKKKGRPVTTTSYMMSLNRDGEGDARPALAFREQNDIE